MIYYFFFNQNFNIEYFVHPCVFRNLKDARLLKQMKISQTVQRKGLQVSVLSRSRSQFSNFFPTYEIHRNSSGLFSLKSPPLKYSVKPRRGDALLFFSLLPTAIPDTKSLHGGCPVIEGEKWSATKWIRVDSFDTVVRDHTNCADENASCERWAELGECTNNLEYMVGSPELPGYCRKSCKVCS